MGELITVDVKEAARITGLSRSKIYELIQEQGIVAKKTRASYVNRGVCSQELHFEAACFHFPNPQLGRRNHHANC